MRGEGVENISGTFIVVNSRLRCFNRFPWVSRFGDALVQDISRTLGMAASRQECEPGVRAFRASSKG